jgi:hypothetical protein
MIFNRVAGTTSATKASLGHSDRGLRRSQQQRPHNVTATEAFVDHQPGGKPGSLAGAEGPSSVEGCQVKSPM